MWPHSVAHSQDGSIWVKLDLNSPHRSHAPRHNSPTSKDFSEDLPLGYGKKVFADPSVARSMWTSWGGLFHMMKNNPDQSSIDTDTSKDFGAGTIAVVSDSATKSETKWERRVKKVFNKLWWETEWQDKSTGWITPGEGMYDSQEIRNKYLNKHNKAMSSAQ